MIGFTRSPHASPAPARPGRCATPQRAPTAPRRRRRAWPHAAARAARRCERARRAADFAQADARIDRVAGLRAPAAERDDRQADRARVDAVEHAVARPQAPRTLQRWPASCGLRIARRRPAQRAPPCARSARPRAAVERALRLARRLRRASACEAAQLQQLGCERQRHLDQPRRRAARRAGRRSPPHLERVAGAVPSTWFMSVISARGRQPGAAGHRRRATRPARVPRRVAAQNAPLPTFTSITSACSPAASFFDRMLAVISGSDSTVAGHVADRVEPLVGRRERGARADDRAAGARAAGAQQRVARRRRRCSRAATRACRACRRCGRGRGRRSSAPRRRRPRRSAPASGSPCRRRRRWSACRAPARQALGVGPGRARSPERVIARVSATVSARLMPLQADRHRQRADLAVAPAARRPGRARRPRSARRRRALPFALGADDLAQAASGSACGSVAPPRLAGPARAPDA